MTAALASAGAVLNLEIMDNTHCPKCGYTKEDQMIHGDHHLCTGTIPEPGLVATGLPGFSKGWEGEKFSLLRDQETTASDRTEEPDGISLPEAEYFTRADVKNLMDIASKAGYRQRMQEESVSPPPQTESRHKYEPEPEHPQFCRQCGYAEHVKLKHF